LNDVTLRTELSSAVARVGIDPTLPGRPLGTSSASSYRAKTDPRRLLGIGVNYFGVYEMRATGQRVEKGMLGLWQGAGSTREEAATPRSPQ
jgi:hypothetical protein